MTGEPAERFAVGRMACSRARGNRCITGCRAERSGGANVVEQRRPSSVRRQGVETLPAPLCAAQAFNADDWHETCR